MRLRAFALLLFLLPASVGSDELGGYFPFAFEELDVSSTALGFTASKAFPDGAPGADLAVCKIEDDAIRYRVDGLNPTASVGTLKPVLAEFSVWGQATIRRFRMIRVTGDADVSCDYYRKGAQ